MPEEEKDVTETPSTPDVETDSSSEETQETQETQTPTAEQGVTQETPEKTEVPFGEHPRFKEVIDEKNYWRQQAEALAQRQPQQPQPQDPYAHLSPEEQVFYRNQEAMMKKIAKQTVDETQKQVQIQIDAARQEFAKMKVTEFRRDHPDVKQGSQEEYQIASLVNRGYDPNHAYWSVMGPKGIQRAQATAQKQVKQQMQEKKKANVEGSVASVTGLPKSKETMEQTASRLIKEAEESGGIEF